MEILGTPIIFQMPNEKQKSNQHEVNENLLNFEKPETKKGIFR